MGTIDILLTTCKGQSTFFQGQWEAPHSDIDGSGVLDGKAKAPGKGLEDVNHGWLRNPIKKKTSWDGFMKPNKSWDV